MNETGISNEVAQLFVQIAEINLDPVLFKKLMDKSREVAAVLSREDALKDRTIDLRVR